MSTFGDWSVVLLEFYFGPDSVGRPVRLTISADMLDQEEAFVALGGKAGFLDAVRAGPEWPCGYYRGAFHRPDTLLSQGLGLLDQFKNEHRRPKSYPKLPHDGPPFLPYLVMLCLAWANTPEDANPNAFYEHLAGLYRNHNMNATLGRWRSLWDQLDAWSLRNKDKIGRFRVEVLGNFPHVGIPKAQVLLVPSRLARLPLLFDSCAFEPDDDPSDEALRLKILGQEVVARKVLGIHLLRLLEQVSVSPAGTSKDVAATLLSIIKSELAEWDGRVPSWLQSRHDEGEWRKLCLMLKSQDDGNGWLLAIGLKDEEQVPSIEDLKISENSCSIRPLAEGFGIMHDDSTGILNASEIVAKQHNELSATGRLVGDRGTSREISVGLPFQPARYFQYREDLGWYIEADELPTESALLLVTPAVDQHWQAWVSDYGGSLVLNPLPTIGMPDGSKLFWIDGLSTLSDDGREMFPDGRKGVRRKPSRIKFHMGTRIGRGRTYLPYDPPSIDVESSGDVTCEVDGAIIQRGAIYKSPLGHAGIQTFNFVVNDKNTRVSFRFAEGNVEIGRSWFRVHRATSLDAVGGDFRSDYLGNSAKQGSRGAVLDVQLVLAEGDTVEFESVHWSSLSQGYDLTDQEIENNPSFRFLDSLAASQTRLPVGEFRRRAQVIARVADPIQLSREARWLSNLGFIDIEYDSLGRWAYFHPAPFCIYTLPWTSSGGYHAAVTGCTAMNTWKELVKAAHKNKVDLRCGHQVASMGSKTCLPPRITLTAHGLDPLRDTAEACRAHWVGNSPARQFANWAGSVEDFKAKLLYWRDGRGDDPVGVYKSTECKIGYGETRFYGYDHVLHEMRDHTTGQHRWYKLVRSAEGVDSHARINQSSWGYWIAHESMMRGMLSRFPGLESQRASFPYEGRIGRLITPYNLVFPYHLARALVFCSGSVPRMLRRPCRAFGHGNQFLPSEYTDVCWVYDYVPETIARTILEKVGMDMKVVDQQQGWNCTCIAELP